MGQKGFAVTDFHLKYGAFIIYIATLNISSNTDDKVYPLRKTYITHLKANEDLTKVFSKYANFTKVFSY